jgi:hypothetical protein
MLLVELARLPATAPAVHVLRDRVLRAPGAVGVVEEVLAGVALAVDVSRLDAVEAGFGRCGEAQQRRYQEKG